MTSPRCWSCRMRRWLSRYQLLSASLAWHQHGEVEPCTTTAANLPSVIDKRPGCLLLNGLFLGQCGSPISHREPCHSLGAGLRSPARSLGCLICKKCQVCEIYRTEYGARRRALTGREPWVGTEGCQAMQGSVWLC